MAQYGTTKKVRPILKDSDITRFILNIGTGTGFRACWGRGIC